jgi:hypothetical protein
LAAGKSPQAADMPVGNALNILPDNISGLLRGFSAAQARPKREFERSAITTGPFKKRQVVAQANFSFSCT